MTTRNPLQPIRSFAKDVLTYLAILLFGAAAVFSCVGVIMLGTVAVIASASG